MPSERYYELQAKRKQDQIDRLKAKGLTDEQIEKFLSDAKSNTAMTRGEYLRNQRGIDKNTSESSYVPVNTGWGGGGGGTGGGFGTDAGSAAKAGLYRIVSPIMKKIFDPSGQKIYEKSPDLYDIPELKFNLPNIQDYMAGGQVFQNAYDKLAPTFWDSYKSSVENPMIARFSGSGSLGSPVAGVSGSAMDALLGRRAQGEAQIAAQAYQSAQAPLMTAYGAETNAAYQQALKPWEAQLEEYQYPYQILPGVLGGSMPTEVIKQPAPEVESGGK